MYKTRFLPNTHIDLDDALRGIAVAGIILYHSVEQMSRRHVSRCLVFKHYIPVFLLYPKLFVSLQSITANK